MRSRKHEKNCKPNAIFICREDEKNDEKKKLGYNSIRKISNKVQIQIKTQMAINPNLLDILCNKRARRVVWSRSLLLRRAFRRYHFYRFGLAPLSSLFETYTVCTQRNAHTHTRPLHPPSGQPRTNAHTHTHTQLHIPSIIPQSG